MELRCINNKLVRFSRVELWDNVSTCLNTNKIVDGNLFAILHRLDKDYQELFSVMV
jgi:hypothetical protein